MHWRESTAKNGGKPLSARASVTRQPFSKTQSILEGTIENLTADGSVTCGAVTGNVSAGGSVRCDDIGGDVNAGGSVRCDKINGRVNAGGSVRMG